MCFSWQIVLSVFDEVGKGKQHGAFTFHTPNRINDDVSYYVFSFDASIRQAGILFMYFELK